MAARRRGPRIERHDGYNIVVGAPVPPQADAITLGRWILVRSRAADSDALIAHELVHVRQFAELGPTRFLARYVGSYLRGRLAGYGHMAAYRRIPLEVEASWLSRVHGRSGVEPGVAAGDLGVTRARAPRPAVAQRLQDEAERMTRDALGTSSWPTTATSASSHTRRRSQGARTSTSRRRKRTSPPNT